MLWVIIEITQSTKVYMVFTFHSKVTTLPCSLSRTWEWHTDALASDVWRSDALTNGVEAWRRLTNHRRRVASWEARAVTWGVGECWWLVCVSVAAVMGCNIRGLSSPSIVIHRPGCATGETKAWCITWIIISNDQSHAWCWKVVKKIFSFTTWFRKL